MNTIEWEEEFVYEEKTYTVWSTVEYEVSGGWSSATWTSPAECPDINLTKVTVDGVKGVTDPLMEGWIGVAYTAGFDFQRSDVNNAAYDLEIEECS